MPGLGEVDTDDVPTNDHGFRIHDEGDERPRKPSRRAANALAAMDQPRQQVQVIAGLVKEQFMARPYTALAVALALGFAIGGGLSTRIGRMALATAGRFAMKELLKQRA